MGDKDSGADLYFILKNEKGKKVHKSEQSRNTETGAMTSFASFNIDSTDNEHVYTFHLWDKDTGFMNKDDKVGVFKNFTLSYDGPGEWLAVDVAEKALTQFAQPSGAGNCELKIDTQRIEPVNPCENDGTCYDTPDYYTCQCRRGWKGDLCDRVDYNNPATDETPIDTTIGF